MDSMVSISDTSRLFSVGYYEVYGVWQRRPELIRDLESSTGSYARVRTGATEDLNIPRYQCRPVY